MCPPFPGALCSVPLGLHLISYTFQATFSLRTFFFLFFFLPIEVKFTSCKIQHTKSENSVALRTFTLLGNHHHFLGSKHIYSHQKESSHHLWSSCSHPPASGQPPTHSCVGGFPLVAVSPMESHTCCLRTWQQLIPLPRCSSLLPLQSSSLGGLLGASPEVKSPQHNFLIKAQSFSLFSQL